MQIWQDKTHDADTNTEVVEPAQKAAIKSTTATRMPVWATAGGEALPAGLQAKLTVSQPGDVYEQEADRVAEQVIHMPNPESVVTPAHSEQNELRMKDTGNGNPHTAGGVHPVVASMIDSGEGQPLDSTTRAFMEPRFGLDFSTVQVRKDDMSAVVAELLGARAFAYRGDVWLGSNESVHDKALMAHELAHIVQQGESVVALRQATRLERRAWLSFFDHYLPRKFLNNYMDDTGAPITLTQAEMVDCNPLVSLRSSKAFLLEVSKLRAAGGGSSTIAVSGWGGALTNGTLGNFTIYYEGNLTVTKAGNWTFDGTMHFHDYWDFDPKPFGEGSGRGIAAEIKVRVAHYGLPGKPFDINSVKVPVQQTDADPDTIWAGGTPRPIFDKSADIGNVTGIAGGEVGGGEAEAQSAKKDLN